LLFGVLKLVLLSRINNQIITILFDSYKKTKAKFELVLVGFPLTIIRVVKLLPHHFKTALRKYLCANSSIIAMPGDHYHPLGGPY